MTDPITPCAWLQRLGRDPCDPVWNDLLRHCTAEVYRVAYGVLREASTAEDVVQEVWLQVRRHAARFEARGSDDDAGARRWLRRIALHCALNWSRGETRRRERERRTAPPLAESSPLDETARRERARLVQELLGRLRPADREILVLHYFDGADHHDLAAACDCSPATARKRLQRALDRLRGIGRKQRVAGALGLVAAVIGEADACTVPVPAQVMQQTLALSPQAATRLGSAGAGFGGGAAVAGGLGLAVAGGVAVALVVATTAVLVPLAEAVPTAPAVPAAAAAAPAIADHLPGPTGLFAREVVIDEVDIELYDLMAEVGRQVGRPMWCFDGSIRRERLDLPLGRVTVAELIAAIDAQVPVTAGIGMADDGGDLIELKPRSVE